MNNVPERFDAARIIRDMRALVGNDLSGLMESTANLERVLNYAFSVTQEREEGRPLEVCFVIAPKGMALPSEQRLGEPAADFSKVARQLCVACDPDRTCLRLEFDDEGNDSVVALTGRPSLESIPGYFRSNLILVEGRAGSRITLHVGDASTAYGAGRYFQPAAPKQLLEILPGEMGIALAKFCLERAPNELRLTARSSLRCDPALYGRYREQIEKAVGDAANRIAAEFVLFITESVRRYHHGGTLIFFPTEDPLPASVGTMKLPYTLSRAGLDALIVEDWNSGATEYVTWYALAALAEEEILIASGLRDPFVGQGAGARWLNWVVNATLRNVLENMRRDAQTCARLSQIDGAVVFDVLARPRGFAAKIQNVAVETLPDDWKFELANRGTRHSSGAYLASRVKGALCIVISQDGGVIAFRDGDGGPMMRPLEF